MNTIREDYTLAYRYARINYKSQWNHSYAEYRDQCVESLITEQVMSAALDSRVKYDDGLTPNLYDRLFDRLVSRYADLIESDFSWSDLVRLANDNMINDDPSNPFSILTGRVYLGTIMNLYPSGKVWTLWAASNVSDIEQFKDQCFIEALDKIAEKFEGWIDSSDGDPCDLFFVMSIDSEPAE